MRRSRNLLRWVAVTLLTLASTFLSAGTPAHGIEPWRIVVRVQGRVESLEPGQTTWSPIFRSRRLNDGALARTLADSVANINLADQTSFRIGPNSEVEMTKFQLTPEGRTVVFNLRTGKIQADVAKALGRQSRFEVRTPNGVLAARGTQFSVTVMKQAELDQLQGAPSKPRASGASVDELLAQTDTTDLVTLVQVDEGTVEGVIGGRRWLLNPGDNAIFGPRGFQLNPPSFPRSQVIPPSQPPPDLQVRHMQFEANSFQDPMHQTTMQQQFNHQYDNAYRPFMAPSGNTNNNAMGGSTGGSTPPLFNPSNTETPLSNTLNSSPSSSPSTGGGTTPTNTGRVIIIIR